MPKFRHGHSWPVTLDEFLELLLVLQFPYFKVGIILIPTLYKGFSLGLNEVICLVSDSHKK